MQLVSREAWGARPPRNQTPLQRSAQLGTAVHYSASDADEQADHARCADRVKSIQNFHMDTRGWVDIAYSYLACKHGFVFEGRGRGIRTAAQGTDAGNDAWHAVCFLGDDTAARDDVTDAGREAIKAAVDHCNAWSGAIRVAAHSFFKATGCPGDDLRRWIAAGMPVAPSTPPPEEEDMATWSNWTDAERAALVDAVADEVNSRLVATLRAGFGGLHPDAAGPQIRPSQDWLYETLGDVASQVAEVHDAVVPPPPP